MRTIRVVWVLTQVPYLIGLALPLGGSPTSGSAGLLSALGCLCGCFAAGALLVEGGPADVWVFALLLPLAHLFLWWGWLAYTLRAGIQAAAASGLALALWLLALAALNSGREHSKIGAGGWGYWCCLAGMAGQCLVALASRSRMNAERRARRARAAANAKPREDAVRAWLDGLEKGSGGGGDPDPPSRSDA